MKIVPTTDDGIAKAIAALQAGLVVAHATETCYGLAADLTNQHAIKRVFDLKKREYSQPVSGLFSSVTAAKEYVIWNDRADDYAGKLPGPLTLILPLKTTGKLYPTPTGGENLGVRVSSHPIAQALAAGMGAPISTTSANISGLANPYSPQDIIDQFGDNPPDLLIDSGTLPENPPSTVISLLAEKEAIVRN